jgi:hypothetical protein
MTTAMNCMLKSVAMAVLLAASAAGCNESASRQIEKTLAEARIALPAIVRDDVVAVLEDTAPESLSEPRLAAALWGHMRDEEGVSVAWWWIEAPPRMRSFVVKNETTGKSLLVDMTDDRPSWEQQLQMEGADKLLHWWGVRVPTSWLGDEDEARVVISIVDYPTSVEATRFVPERQDHRDPESSEFEP